MGVDDTLTRNLIVRNLSTHNITIDSILFPDGVTGIQENPKHTNHILRPLEPDTIEIALIPTNECNISDSILIYHDGQELVNPLKVRFRANVSWPTSIKEKSSFDKIVKVYPNPTTDNLNIVVSENIPGVEAQLFNIFGERVFSKELPKEGLTVNISEYTKGMYLLKVKDYSKQIIIK